MSHEKHNDPVHVAGCSACQLMAKFETLVESIGGDREVSRVKCDQLVVHLLGIEEVPPGARAHLEQVLDDFDKMRTVYVMALVTGILGWSDTANRLAGALEQFGDMLRSEGPSLRKIARSSQTLKWMAEADKGG